MNKKIAVPINEKGMLDGHFGHCKYFSLITVEGTAVLSEEKILAPPHEPGLLPQWLAEKGVTDIIAGGMGQRAIQLFNQRSVNVFVGAPHKLAKELVINHIEGSLVLSANYCDH